MASSRRRLPPMPLWLRILGVLTCLLPLLVLPVSMAWGAKSAVEFFGGLLFIAVVYGIPILFSSLPALGALACWCLGWRPGIAVSAALLGAAGITRLLDGDTQDWQTYALLLHLPLLAAQLWEWRRAANHTRTEQSDEPPATDPTPDW